MPAKSTKQKKLMCIALSMKSGQTPKSYSKQAARLADSMTEESLEDYCESTSEEEAAAESRAHQGEEK